MNDHDKLELVRMMLAHANTHNSPSDIVRYTWSVKYYETRIARPLWKKILHVN